VPWEPARLLCKRFNIAAAPSSGGDAGTHFMAAQASAAAGAVPLPLSVVSSSAAAAKPPDVDQLMSTESATTAAATPSAPARAPPATDAPVDVSAAEELAFKPRPSMDLFKAIFEEEEDDDVLPPVIAAPTSIKNAASSQQAQQPLPQMQQPKLDEPKLERAATIGPLIPAEFRRPQPDEMPATEVVMPPPATVVMAAHIPELHTTDTAATGVDGHVASVPDGPPNLPVF